MSLGGNGLGVRRRFPETPLTTCDGDVPASAQTGSRSAGPGASVPCVRHGSQAVDVDHGQFVGRRLDRFAVVMGLDELDRPTSGNDALILAHIGKVQSSKPGA